MARKELYGANRYILNRQLGEGTYGIVFKATDIVTKEKIAVKRIKYLEGTNVTAQDVNALNVTDLREIKLLKKLHHPNIIRLLDVYPYNNMHHLVFELMETDLDTLIKYSSKDFVRANCKSYMQMLLTGLVACHKQGIVHRNLKSNNLLLNFEGQLKIADFGLARVCTSHGKQKVCTPEVFIPEFRAPELLFGATNYGPEVDIWAAACIFAELILGLPLFKGEFEIDILLQIFEKFGTPSEIQWPEMTTLPKYMKFMHCNPQSFGILFPDTSADCLDLLQQMFALDPKQRISAQQALEHKYFNIHPTPIPAHCLQSTTKQEASKSFKSSKLKRVSMELKRKRHEGSKSSKTRNKDDKKRIKKLQLPSLNDNLDYEVEAIVDSRIVNDKLQYLVHWKGYRLDESTWEPAKNLENAAETVSAFHRKQREQV